MELIPVNGEALNRALEAVSGPEVAALTLKAYEAIDKAMKYGFDKGREADSADFREAIEIAESETKLLFETLRANAEAEVANAYERGKSDGAYHADDISEEANQESYDNGYVDGVQDARVDPEEADDYIAYLVSLDGIDADEVDDYDHQADEDGFDGTYDT